MLRKKIFGIEHIFFLLGFVMTIGEKMNKYFAYASSLYTYVGGVVIVVSFFSILQSKVINKYYTNYKLFWLFFVSVFLITSFHYFMTNSFDSIIEYYKVPIFILLGCCSSYNMFRNEKVVEYLLLGFILGQVLLLPFGSTGIYDDGIRFMGTYMNPNTYAVDCIVVIFSSFFFAEKNDKRINKFIFYFISVLFMFELLRTGTRGALLGIGTTFILLYFFSKNRLAKISILIVSLLICLLFIIINVDLKTIASIRLFDKSFFNNERLKIWGEYLKNMNLYFWTGLTDQQIKMIYYKTPHNAFIGMFVRYGILTFIIYTFLLLKMFFKCLYILKKDTENSLYRNISCIYLAVCISGLFSENLTFRVTYLIQAICVWMLYKIVDHGAEQNEVGRRQKECKCGDTDIPKRK